MLPAAAVLLPAGPALAQAAAEAAKPAPAAGPDTQVLLFWFCSARWCWCCWCFSWCSP
ncbi:hypothetical protein ACFQT0_05630 [Hymenobacter humi]|uniref:Uncharacterized protein n=1 Tax=Hymenobacter humi TaxID=1411620 RepID=A0ABW2U1Z2_9BACT